MFNILLLILMVLEPITLNALPEESYLLSAPLEDDLYLYMDTRSENDPKQTETRRRSILDRNFARLGRGDLPALLPYDYDSDVYDNFERQTRSGEKNDQFIRFGRGNSDFVRFGRDRAGQHFLRFGRSVNGKTRSKREADFEKRAGSKNFVRFGRNDNFMRFGRDPEEVNYASTTKPHQKDVDFKNEYLIRMLVEMLRKARPHGETLRLA